MDTDDPPAPAAAVVEVDGINVDSSPFIAEWDLQAGARTLLERLRVLEPTQNVQYSHLIKADAPPVQLAWRPLVPLADLSSLVAVIAPEQRPAELPFHVEANPEAPETRARLLEAVARLALDPALTIEVLVAFRPVATALVGRWIEALGLSDEGKWRDGEFGVEMAAGERVAVTKVYRAVVRALPLLGEQVMP